MKPAHRVTLRTVVLCLTVLAGGVSTLRSETEKPVPDPVVVSLKKQFEKEFKKLDPQPSFEIPDSSAGKTLVIRYKTRKYMIHPSSKIGVGHDLVETEGPDNGGFIIRIHVQPQGTTNQAQVPQTLNRPYWSTHLDIYPTADRTKQIYASISYRGSADQKLIENIRKFSGRSPQDEK